MGYLFAIATALFSSLKALFSKISLKDINEYAFALAFRMTTLLFFIPLVRFPELGAHFVPMLLLSGTLHTGATIFYMKAFKSGDISLTFPMINFTPITLLVTSPIFLGEFPSVPGLLGILSITIGAYILGIKAAGRGPLAPFKELFKSPGPRYMLLVAVIWGFTGNFDKIGVESSSPIFWAFSLNLFMTLILFPFYIRPLIKERKQLKKIVIPLCLTSLCSIGSTVTHFYAIKLILVTYLVSIKRIGTLFSILLGFLFFKEKNIKSRLAGSLIMVAGALLVIFKG